MKRKKKGPNAAPVEQKSAYEIARALNIEANRRQLANYLGDLDVTALEAPPIDPDAPLPDKPPQIHDGFR